MAVPHVHGLPDRLTGWAGATPAHHALVLARAVAELGATGAAGQLAPIAVFTLDRGGIVRFANPAFERLMGTPAHTLVGQPASFLVGASRFDPASMIGRLEHEGTTDPLRVEAVDADGNPLELVASFGLDPSPANLDGTGEATLVVYCSDVSGADPEHVSVEAEHDRWRLLLQHIADTITIVDEQLRVKEVATYDPELLGRESSDYLGANGLSLLHPDDQLAAAAAWAEVLASPGNETRVVFRMQHAGGHFEQIEFGCVNLLDDPVINGVLMTTRNVTSQMENEALIARQSEILELIARDCPLDETLGAVAGLMDDNVRGRSGILLLRDDARALEIGSYGSVEPQLLDLLRRTPMTPSPRLDTLDIRRPIVITDIASDPRTSALAGHTDGFDARSAWSVPIVENRTDELLGLIFVLDDASREPNDHEREVGALASHLAAIAIERSRALLALEHQATHDEVTGLPNRTSLMAALTEKLAVAAGRGTKVALLFVDIDRFKAVNDSFGHAGGDTLLVRFGRRLRTLVPPDDFVGTFGGDEFVIVVESDDPVDEAQAIGARIDLALSEPFSLDEGEVFVSTSIGVAVADGSDLNGAAAAAAVLLRDADMARSRAKELGRDRLELFDQPMRQRADARLRTDRELRQALETDELVLHFQPTVDITTGAVIGAEALLRWQHPTKGLLLPDEFLPVAEGSGTILRIGRIVLDGALEQARRWVDADPDLDPFIVTVNLSAREVSAPGLATLVRRALDRYDWPPDHLVLDLTERILVEDRDTALRALDALKRVGVQLAIDDFGTGFSSLSYLHRFPVDIVKIDPSFVANLAADATGSPVVNAVLHMAKALGLDVVAEGVEHLAQLEGLRRLGCRLAQGSLLGEAAAPAERLAPNRSLP